jgi:AmiR/NasT family two-component response regulator
MNNKLIERAQNLLRILYNVEEKDALVQLEKNGMNLRKVIHNLQNKENQIK